MSSGDMMKFVISDDAVPPKMPLEEVVFGSAFRIGDSWYMLLDHRDEDGDLAALNLNSKYSTATLDFFDCGEEVDEVRPVTITI